MIKDKVYEYVMNKSTGKSVPELMNNTNKNF